MGFTIYEVISILGTLAVSGKDCSISMVDCYLHDWTILIVSVSFLFGRLAYLPVTVEVGRTRLIELYSSSVNEKNFKYFNIAFMVVATFFSILSPYLSVALLLNIVGAVVCYLFIYLIPTKIHYGCLYPKKSNKNEVEMGLTDDMSTQSSSSHCNHDDNYVDRHTLAWRKVTYGLINVAGIVIGVVGLLASMHQIANT